MGNTGDYWLFMTITNRNSIVPQDSMCCSALLSNMVSAALCMAALLVLASGQVWAAHGHPLTAHCTSQVGSAHGW